MIIKHILLKFIILMLNIKSLKLTINNKLQTKNLFES